MGTIAEKLALLQETKENIRQAITNMGGTVPEGEVFAASPACIYNIPPTTELPSGVYTLTMENPAPEQGSITPAVGSYYVSRKVPVTLTAEPSGGYVFSGWSRFAGKATMPTFISENPYTFNMSTNVRFVANFEAAG